MSVETVPQLILHAPAKLNLFLKVLGKRADGYHEIDTVMQAIDLRDTLRFRPLPQRELRLELRQLQYSRHQSGSADLIPVDQSNLVIKAARLLQEFSGTEHGAEIHLTKRIPSQAGLGGGSADAGVTLQGLNRLWNLGLSSETLCELAAQLGSDIPFFAAGHTLARCLGRGETLSQTRGRALNFVIVKPAAGLSTAKVYANCPPSTFSQSGKEVLTALHSGAATSLKLLMENSLEQSARELSPEVDQVLRRMSELPFICSMLSGSGSACYGVCQTQRQALQLAGRLKWIPDTQVLIARSLV